MCVLSIEVPIRKKSGNLLKEPRTWYVKLSDVIEYFICSVKYSWERHFVYKIQVDVL